MLAGFVAQSPDMRIRLIMSAYMVAAAVAAFAGLIGYFGLLPGSYDLFTEFGRARGTFKDPNVLGAFLVPALLYAFNEVMSGRMARASLWLGLTPALLLGSLLSFSRGAWINLAVSLVVYACFSFATVSTHRLRLKLTVYVVLAAMFIVGLLAAAQSVPQIAEVLGTRTTLEQSYDVGPEGRFGGQIRAVGLILTHPLAIGALEFARLYDNEDAHQVYLSMFLNAGLDRRHPLSRHGAAHARPGLAPSGERPRRQGAQRGAGRGLYRHGVRGRGDRHRSLAPFLSDHGDDLGYGARSAVPASLHFAVHR